jgi:hypothetical protein
MAKDEEKLHKPTGRKMPHPLDAKKADGSIDTAIAEAALAEVVESYRTGEYTLLDMNEGAVDKQLAQQLARLCNVKASDGDEFYIAIRKRNF